MSVSAAPRPATRRGTPLAPAWSPEWIARVEALEDELDRRVCGARTPTGNPCRMQPAHTSPGHNGRCNFHGGADLAGGQPGNQNAATHGLYTRGLRPCSQACPLWHKCPLACQDIADLEPRDRPVCPYELHDYEKAVEAYTQMLAPLPGDGDEFNVPEAIVTIMKYKEDIEADRIKAGQPPIFLGLNQNASGSDEHPGHTLPLHLVDLVHRTATLAVMVNRAAAAMREADVIDQTHIHSTNYNATYARPHAYVQAYLRLSSEFRRYHAMLKEFAPTPAPKKDREHASLAELLSPIHPPKNDAGGHPHTPTTPHAAQPQPPLPFPDHTNPADPSRPPISLFSLRSFAAKKAQRTHRPPIPCPISLSSLRSLAVLAVKNIFPVAPVPPWFIFPLRSFQLRICPLRFQPP